MVDILKQFPYETPREIQAQALEVLGTNWDNYDVFVVGAPTAFGKTAVAKCIMNTFGSVSVLTPTNLLIDQFRAEFPDTRSLKRMDLYSCAEWKRPCSVTYGKLKKFCKGCDCGKDMSVALYRNGPGIYNYHMYLAKKLYRKVLVADEAHNLIPIIKDQYSFIMWQHDYKYPSNMFTTEQIRAWVEKLPKSKRKNKKVEILEDAVTHRKPMYVPTRTKEWFNGKGTTRGEPEERDCLKLTPVDIRGMPPVFWPREVEKIVLLSATISHKDIETLGLSKKRVLYIGCESPIPSGNRPIVTHDVASVNRSNIEQSAAQIADYIEKVLAPAHQGEKGVIHATYQLASILAGHLGSNPRYLFHTRENKAEQYKLFRQSPVESGRILVACGMYEGMDLPEDLGRWQVIAKIPWPSLGNSAIKHLAEQDPDWFNWETWRIVMQACGRICRTPTDFGVSYILDSTFWRLWNEGQHLIPEWFKDGLRAGGSIE